MTALRSRSGGVARPAASVPHRAADRGGDLKLVTEGTHRAAPLAETIARAGGVADRIGVTRVADVTGLDDIGIPVVMAYRPMSRGLSVSQGKGLTRDAAIASGLMECIELHHAEHIQQPLRLASAQEMQRAGRLVDLAGLSRAHNSRFHPGLRIPWIEGTSLGDGGRTWLPFEVVDLDLVLPRPYLTGCFQGSSNGLASGNTRTEAIVHALCELIERDARVLWQLGPERRRRRTRLPRSEVRDPANRMLLDRFERAGVAVGIWDVTSDIDVSCYRVVVCGKDPNDPRRVAPAAGHGCHLDATVALSRALTEAAQARLTIIAGARDDLSRETYLHGRDRGEIQRTIDLCAEPPSGPVASMRPSVAAASLDEDLDVILGALRAGGLPDPVVVDLTEPDLAIPVVSCIVPGLEGHPDVDHDSVRGPRANAVLATREARQR